MNILRRLLSHAFLIAVVVVILLGYIYRKDLFPGLFDDKATDTTAVVSPSASESVEADSTQTASTEAVAIDTSSAKKDSTTAGAGNRDTATSTASESPAATSEASQTEEIAETDQQPAIGQDATHEHQVMRPSGQAMPPIIESKTGPSNELVARPAETGQNTTSPQVAPGMPRHQAMNPYTQAMPRMGQRNTNMQHEPTPEQEKAAKLFKLITEARQAFWSKKYDDAEKYYQSIIALDPGNPDLTGEAGNFYYAQGKWDQAAENYYQCALSLLQSRRYGQAAYMSKIIRGLDKDLADKLDEKLKEISSPK